jgi:hypothetical protein
MYGIVWLASKKKFATDTLWLKSYMKSCQISSSTASDWNQALRFFKERQHQILKTRHF